MTHNSSKQDLYVAVRKHFNSMVRALLSRVASTYGLEMANNPLFGAAFPTSRGRLSDLLFPGDLTSSPSPVQIRRKAKALKNLCVEFHNCRFFRFSYTSDFDSPLLSLRRRSHFRRMTSSPASCKRSNATRGTTWPLIKRATPPLARSGDSFPRGIQSGGQ